MTHCPDCRNPITSLMLLDARVEPEYYCDRCARGWPVVAGARAPRRAQKSPAAARPARARTALKRA